MQTLSRKPTVRTNDTAAMRAVQQAANYAVSPTSTGWTVSNRISGERYQVEVSGRCTCPHAQRINRTGAVCKHFALCDLTERTAAMVAAPAPLSRDERIYRDFGPDL